MAQIYAGAQTPELLPWPSTGLRHAKMRSTGDVFQELVAAIDPLIAVEKSPAYTVSMERRKRIHSTFPEAHFIHLIRHPVPQGKSVLNLNEGIFAYFVNSFDFMGDQLIVDPQIAWHDININILNFLHMVPPECQLRIRGEDFMAQPRDHLLDICRWLDIRDDDEALAAMMHPERSPFTCFGPVTALFGNDPNFLRGPAFRQHKPKIPPLNGGALPWRDDGKGLMKRS